jgi:hypothetical protein
MQRKGIAPLGIVATLLLLSMMVISSNALSDFEMPTWNEGDYWKYDVQYDSFSGRSNVEVKQARTITIEDQQYDARIVTIHRNVSGQFMGSSYTFESDFIKYYRESDMLLMKYIEDSSVTGHSELVYSPPFVGMDWPITVDKEWERHTTATITNSSGTETKEVDFYYKCTAKTDVNTKAGLFTCYIVKTWRGENEEDDYNLFYMSPNVGYQYVMYESYEDGEMTYQKKLTSFKYTKPSENNGEGIPGFELTLLIIAITSVILIKRWRKN